MSYNYNRDGALYSYYMMFQDSNSSSIIPYYNASFADLVDLGISSDNGYSFNGTVQGFLEELTNGSNIAVANAENANLWTPTGFKTFTEILGNKNIFNNTDAAKFWNGSSFVTIPMADSNTNGGITNATFIDWNTRLSGNMGTYTNYVNWITDVSSVANAAAGVATCASSDAAAALNAIGTVPVGSNIMGIIGNVNNMPQNTNIIDWSANISSIASNANSSATNAINTIGNVPSGNSVMGYIGDVNNIPTPYNNIIDWVSGELGDISTQLTNIIGS